MGIVDNDIADAVGMRKCGGAGESFGKPRQEGRDRRFFPGGGRHGIYGTVRIVGGTERER